MVVVVYALLFIYIRLILSAEFGQRRLSKDRPITVRCTRAVKMTKLTVFLVTILVRKYIKPSSNELVYLSVWPVLNTHTT